MNNQQTKSNLRELKVITAGKPTSDGDGVKLTRLIGTAELDMLDPFLMLDCFESDEPNDYLGGFPTHPHRGFETVTYLLNGQMRHKDSAGNEGLIKPGGVQWMSAGRGILHSEMPEQRDGLLKGFQLWVNLPASAKMSEPAYQEFPADVVPVEDRGNGFQARIIAGKTDKGTTGPVINNLTQPIYMDVQLEAGEVFQQAIPGTHNAFVYVIAGELKIGERLIQAGRLGVFGEGDGIAIQAISKQDTSEGSRFLLVAGKPIGEPVARYGPFVMNTEQEIAQAFKDYREQKLTN